MAKASFFGPTGQKLVIPMSFFALIAYGDLYASPWCCPTLWERFVFAYSNFEHTFFVLLVILMAYYFSCSVVYFLSPK